MTRDFLFQVELMDLGGLACQDDDTVVRYLCGGIDPFQFLFQYPCAA
jgi:hypothetical protein